MANTPDNDNDKTLVLSLKKHLPAKTQGLAQAPERKKIAISENMGLSSVALNLNPLVQAAGALIAVLSELKLPEVFCDVDKLHRKLVTQVKEFENAAKLKGVAAMNVLVARYVICAALDEAVLSLASAEHSSWASQSLLSIFHEDAGGGEKFFVILDCMNQDPALNIDMLELIYLCLTLGFEGKYRLMEHGHEQLQTMRESLYHRILQQRKRDLQPLSDHCQKTDRDKRISLGLPLRRVFAATCIILLVFYLGFAITIHLVGDSTEKTFDKLLAASKETISKTGS